MITTSKRYGPLTGAPGTPMLVLAAGGLLAIGVALLFGARSRRDDRAERR